MPPTRATIGYGATFAMGAGSPVTYTTMAEIGSISFADYTISEIDTTHLLSPNTTEESIPGMIKPGTIEMTGNYIGDTTQQNIDAVAIARTVFPWKIMAPASNATQLTITAYGYITKKEIGPLEPNKKIDFKLSVRVSGAITYTVA